MQRSLSEKDIRQKAIRPLIMKMTKKLNMRYTSSFSALFSFEVKHYFQKLFFGGVVVMNSHCSSIKTTRNARKQNTGLERDCRQLIEFPDL